MGATGTFTLKSMTRHKIKEVQESTGNTFLGNFSGASISETPMLDAEFDYGYLEHRAEYSIEGKTVDAEPKTYVGTMFKCMDSAEEEVVFPHEMVAGDLSGSSSAGFEWSSDNIANGWDGTVFNGGGRSWDVEKDDTIALPKFCKVQIFWDGKVVEELLAREVTP